MQQECIVCGKIFISERGRQYCRNACRNLKWKLTKRDSYLASGRKYRERLATLKPEREIITRNCVWCKKQFDVNKYHPEQKCCSSLCNTKWYQSTHKEKVREWKTKERKKYKKRYAKVNALYKDKIRFSGNQLRALSRDNYTCQNCGYKLVENPTKAEELVVHHVDRSGQTSKPNNRIDNLQTLCRACHIRIHTHQVTLNK